MPTATWKSRLMSGSAHCDLQLAVEVRQCPLGSGARGGGPAVPTGIWTERRRRRVRRRRRQRRRRRRTLIKSNNPHLAGGEKPGRDPSWVRHSLKSPSARATWESLLRARPSSKSPAAASNAPLGPPDHQ